MSKKELVPAGVTGPLLDSDESTSDVHEQLEQLHREHHEHLINYVYSWVHCRADARDIVQEAFCRLFRLRDLSAVHHVRALLFKTAKNIATDYIRKRIVREAFAEQEPLRANCEAPSPEHIWLAREDLQSIQRAIDALPPRTQHALKLMREDGLSYEELAQILGIKTHSARRLIERAMEYLAGAMAEHPSHLRERNG
jgi:RNA polymerase sigma factor (sigma-70 family)